MMAPYTCTMILPLHNGSLHLCNDLPSSTQWLPTPVQWFSLTAHTVAAWIRSFTCMAMIFCIDGSLHLYNDSPSSQWLPTPVQRLSLHLCDDSPSSQWLPTPVQRFSLFMMAPYYIYHASVCDGIFTMVPYTCTTILPLHNV
jgi:hypothetical protein